MKGKHLWFGAVPLLAALVLAAYYWTGWNAARAHATAVALGRSLSDDNFLAEQLGYPREGDLLVSTRMDDLPVTLPPERELPFRFKLRSLNRSDLPPVEVSVSIRASLRGWEIIGFGQGG